MLLDGLRSAVTHHRVAAEVALGVGIGIALGLGTAAQDGFTTDALLRGLTLGIGMAWAIWFLTRRRRIEAEQVARERIAAQLALARELHDTVAGQVGIIGIQAAAARRIIATQPDQAAAALERIETAARAANADLRRMLVALRQERAGARDQGDASAAPAPAALGLGEIDGLMASARADGLTVTAQVDPAARSILDPALDQAAYRIVQEALTNVLAHAGGAAVTVRAALVADRLELDIVNGPGGTPDGATSSGLGLVGMRERVAAFGGSLETAGTAEGGFAVRARLPIHPEATR